METGKPMGRGEGRVKRRHGDTPSSSTGSAGNPRRYRRHHLEEGEASVGVVAKTARKRKAPGMEALEPGREGGSSSVAAMAENKRAKDASSSPSVKPVRSEGFSYGFSFAMHELGLN